MPNLNRVMLMGNLTRDPELRYTSSNTAVANLGMAVNRTWFDKNANEKKQETTFLDLEAWGKTAEVLNQYLRKGRPLYVEGRLKLEQWTDKDGGNRSKLKVVVESFEFLDSGKDQDGGNNQPARQPSASRQTAPARSGPHEPLDDDDVPF